MDEDIECDSLDLCRAGRDKDVWVTGGVFEKEAFKLNKHKQRQTQFQGQLWLAKEIYEKDSDLIYESYSCGT